MQDGALVDLVHLYPNVAWLRPSHSVSSFGEPNHWILQGSRNTWSPGVVGLSRLLERAFHREAILLLEYITCSSLMWNYSNCFFWKLITARHQWLLCTWTGITTLSISTTFNYSMPIWSEKWASDPPYKWKNRDSFFDEGTASHRFMILNEIDGARMIRYEDVKLPWLSLTIFSHPCSCTLSRSASG